MKTTIEVEFSCAEERRAEIEVDIPEEVLHDEDDLFDWVERNVPDDSLLTSDYEVLNAMVEIQEVSGVE